MLKVKNGKLIASNMSFALPEEFNLDLKLPGGQYHLLHFASEKRVIKGGVIYIDVEFEDAELTAKEAMKEFAEDCELKIKGEFFPVTRGKGTAIGVHYKGTEGYSDYYEERYDFPPNRLQQNQVTVSIQLLANRGQKLGSTIEDAMKLPNVKAFLDSIEYF